MATIAMMVGGAVLNATTFVGGSYLARYLSGSNHDAERERHDKALEKYQRDYEEYHEKRSKLLDWYAQKMKMKREGEQHFINTDEALKLYRKVHSMNYDLPPEPKFSDYYKPSNSQKTGEMIYVGGGMLALGYLASRFI